MAFSGIGAGTSGDPYQITTASQFLEIYDDMTAHYLLMNDIDFITEEVTFVRGNTSTFSGSLDGDGFTVKGSIQNIFRAISGTIRDFELISTTIASGGDGHISRNFSGTAENVIVRNNPYFFPTNSGGLFYLVTAGTITSCEFYGTARSMLHEARGCVVNDCKAVVYRGIAALATFIGNGFQANRFSGKLLNAGLSHWSGTTQGGIFGDNLATTVGQAPLISQCWVYVDIGLSSTGGGILGKGSFTAGVGQQVQDCYVWGRVVNRTTSSLSRIGLIAGELNNALQTGNTGVVRCLADVDYINESGLATMYSHTGGTGSSKRISNCKTNSTKHGSMSMMPSTYLGSPHNEQLTESVMYGPASAWHTSGSGFDFDTVWLNNAEGRHTLRNNPEWIYEGGFFQASVAVARHSSNQARVTTSFAYDVPTGPIRVLCTRASDSAVIDSVVSETFDNIILTLPEEDDVTYNFTVLYDDGDGEVSVGFFSNYRHFVVEQPPVLTVTQLAKKALSSPKYGFMHGSVIVGQYAYFSSRRFMTGYDPAAFGGVVKIDMENVGGTYEYARIFDGTNDGNEIEQIIYAQGFLWGYCHLSGQTRLLRINPSDMSWDSSLSGGNFRAGDPIVADDEFFYFTDGSTVKKAAISTFTGIMPALITSEMILASLTMPSANDHACTNHSAVVDSTHVYIARTTGPSSSGTSEGQSFTLNKVRKSDFTNDGYVQIPRCTDDMTQNEDWLFLGYEDTGEVGNPFFGCGALAVRKSDLQVFLLPPLHAMDRVDGATKKAQLSYASLVFGNYLIDSKVNSKIYVIDISDPSQWSLETNIGQFTIAAFDTIPVDGDVFNEIVLNEDGEFLSSTWGRTADIVKYTLPGELDFFSVPTVQAVEVDTSGDDPILTGFILDTGGLTVTERGFKIGTSPENLNITLVSGDSTQTFEATFEAYDPGQSYYAKAYAINARGQALSSQTLEFGTLVLSPPTVGSTGVTVEGQDASLSAPITHAGNASITAQGFQYGTDPENLNLSASGSLTSLTITALLEDLAAGTWHVRAYATNSEGTGYGEVASLYIAPEIGFAGSIHRNGAPLAGADVYAIATDLSTAHHANSSADGTYRIAGLDPQKHYHVFATFKSDAVTYRAMIKVYRLPGSVV